MNSISNVIRFPIEHRRADIDTLSAIEPDILLADALSERFGLEILPFDMIDAGEIEARARIVVLECEDRAALPETLERLNRLTIGRAIGLCREAASSNARASALRARSDEVALIEPANLPLFSRIADNAESTAAALTLSAIAAAHRARGIDAAITQALRRRTVKTAAAPDYQPASSATRPSVVSYRR